MFQTRVDHKAIYELQHDTGQRQMMIDMLTMIEFQTGLQGWSLNFGYKKNQILEIDQPLHQSDQIIFEKPNRGNFKY